MSKPKAEKTEVKKPEGRPLTAKELVLAALEDPLLRGVPTLLGPSGGGKTWLAQEVHRERHPEGVLVTIVPASESGDELAGIPLRPSKAGQTIEWSLPLCVPKKLLAVGGTVFVDEMDKAAPDVWPVLLRLLAERKLRDTALPDSVDIICAANSPQIPLPDPLVGRLFWVRFPEPPDHNLTGDPALRIVPAGILARLQTQQASAVAETKYPLIPPSRRAAHRLASWMRWTPLWEANQDGRQRVLAGVLPAQDVPEALQHLAAAAQWSTLESALVFLRGQSPSSVMAALLDLVWGVPHTDYLALMQALEQRVKEDKTEEWKRVWDRATEDTVVIGVGASEDTRAKLRIEWMKGPPEKQEGEGKK